MSMKFLADNGGLQALIQAIKDMFALFDHNKQNKLVAGRGITINQSTRVISSDGEPNVQADWNMATESSASFIRNKPNIYTKSEINSMFSATITFVRVNELPAVGTNGTVYLVPKQDEGTDDLYDEYLWLSASGSVEAHYELIGSTSVDLSNYYTKTETNTLLDGKQASISITNKTDDAGDNDKVILQANGVTDTTTFVRRSLTNLLNWFRSKLDEVYVPFGWIAMNEVLGMTPRLYNSKLDDVLWGADKRYDVTWKVYDGTTHEQLYDKSGYIPSLFDGSFQGSLAHPVTGEYEVLTIQPIDNDGSQTLRTYWQGTLILYFYYTHAPLEAPTCRIKQRNSNTWTTLTATKLRGSAYKINLAVNPNWYYLNTLEITIQGKTDTTEGGGTSLRGVVWIPSRYSYSESSVVTKYAYTQSLYGNIVAPKFQTRGGTANQFVLGDGTLQNSPIPISKGGTGSTTAIGAEYNILNQVADSTASTLTGARKVALCNETKSASNGVFRWVTLQKIWDSHIPSFKYSSQEGFGVTIIADLTDSFTNQTWMECGINGIILGHRSGFGQGTIVQRITCWGNRSADTTYLFTDCVDDKAYKPLLLLYNSRYYLAIESTSSAREVLFFGHKAKILDSLIKLYRANGKWYSDSAKTQEVSVEIVKSYSRYPNAYLNFGGTASQVVLGTGELKAIDSTPTSASTNLITSGAVASAIAGIDMSGKVNLQPDFTAQQIDYTAGNVGKWQKVLRFPAGVNLMLNIKKTAMGNDMPTTIWFASSSMGDNFTSLYPTNVRFVHESDYIFLCLKCKKASAEPTESYTIQVVHSSVPRSDIEEVTGASPITATPNEPNIVYRAPVTTGAVSFNVNSSGAGSVNMSGHNDFLGNMTAEASDGVVVTMSGATEGQIYRFVFTRNIEGGVTFKQSNVAYCTISGDVNAGDTITLTAVSNTADGWLYEQQSAGIKSSDGSINVEYEGSTADLSLNLPSDIVRNNEWTSSVGHRVLAIGDGASADTMSNNVAIGKDADASGNSATCVGGDSEASGTYGTALGYSSVANAIGATAFGAYAKADGFYCVAIGGTQSSARTTAKGYAVAVGAGSYANTSSVAIGYGAKAEKTSSVAIGRNNEVEGANSIVIGQNAISESDGAISIGKNIQIPYGQTHVNSITIGNDTNAFGNGAISIGNEACTAHEYSIAIGEKAKVCRWDNGGDYVSRAEEMNLQSFTVDGEIRKFYKPATAGDVTVTFSGGQTATVNVSKGTLFIVNDATAPNITAIFNGILLDGRYYDTMNGAVNLNDFAITSIDGLNAYAIDVKMPLAYVDTSEVSNARIFVEYAAAFTAEGCALGHDARSYGGYALGRGAVTMFPRQTVVGQYNVPSERDCFQVGYGNGETQRRNILTIDSDERMVINAGYVGGTQTIEMNQQTGSLGNITKAVYRIRWDGTGTATLTLNASGCVEGQRVTIYAETNDVHINGCTNDIPQGRFADFMLLSGAWRPMMGY